MNEEMEETSSKWNVSNSFPGSPRQSLSFPQAVVGTSSDVLFVFVSCFLLDDRSKTEALREEVELTLKETKDLFLTETDNISLLDIPSTFLLLDADHPEASK